MNISIEAAREAKPKVAALARQVATVVGVGLTKSDGSYAVKVNLGEPCGRSLPASVDGVPVLYEVVGRIVPRRAGTP
jgi:hypothetical protein